MTESPESRIQLWTDENDSEFAICLIPSSASTPIFVIKTNEKVSYTKKIDESVCMQGYTYDWKHTLIHWVEHIYGNKIIMDVNPTIIESEKSAVKAKEKRTWKPVRYNISYGKRNSGRPAGMARSYLNKGSVKCRFCNLKYFLEEERNEHEQFWHAGLKTD